MRWCVLTETDFGLAYVGREGAVPQAVSSLRVEVPSW
jgi:hypothetical protein